MSVSIAEQAELRAASGYRPKGIESEASVFACAVLVPADQIRADVRDMRIDFCNDAWLHALSKKYGVSITVIVFRLHTLNLLKIIYP